MFLALSRRAILDLAQIEHDSKERWGSSIAKSYMQSLEDALVLLRKSPKLLRTKSDISKYFKLYRVRQHFIVCVLLEPQIYVLTIKHGAMDLPTRLAELEPHLLDEVTVLHAQFLAKRKRSKSS